MDAKDYAKQIALFAILDGQYDPIEAERIISSALSAQAAEVERLNSALGLRDARINELMESRDYWFREYTELKGETNELHQPEPSHEALSQGG